MSCHVVALDTLLIAKWLLSFSGHALFCGVIAKVPDIAPNASNLSKIKSTQGVPSHEITKTCFCGLFVLCCVVFLRSLSSPRALIDLIPLLGKGWLVGLVWLQARQQEVAISFLDENRKGCVRETIVREKKNRVCVSV